MKYFGIKTPEKKHQESHIFWFSKSKYGSWVSFLTRSPENKKCSGGGFCPNGICMADAIRAYEAIGYKCVELDVTVKE